MIFEQACRFLEKHGTLAMDYVELNLSVVQCEDEHLADRLIAYMERYRVNPKWINLEITETASIGAKGMLQQNMEKLLAYGVGFSLDDFGKGESNLMYVVELPVSIIKLDIDMTKAYFRNKKAEQVLRTVVTMAHEMNFKLVAEGVETEDELEGLKSLGVDYIQGFYFSKPLPSDEYLAFIENKAK